MHESGAQLFPILLGIWESFVRGYMDDVRTWNTVRTQQRIQRVMSCSLVGDEPGLVGRRDLLAFFRAWIWEAA